MMLRLIVIDDEETITNYLASMLESRLPDSIEIIKAYSAWEALEFMERHRVDIILSDINMPEMDGLELHRKMMEKWPRSKVIFLTGYQDFQYVQKALRNKAIDYLLKTEEDDRIAGTVEKAIGQIEKELEHDAFHRNILRKLELALPFLQHEVLLSILHEEPDSISNLGIRFEDTGLQLDPTLPVLLILCRIDDWRTVPNHERSQTFYKLSGILEEYWSPHNRIALCPVTDQLTAVFLQPDSMTPGMVTAVHESADMVQSMCEKMVGIALSIFLSRTPNPWPQIGRQYELLLACMSKGIGIGYSVILIEPAEWEAAPTANAAQSGVSKVRDVLSRLDRLRMNLESGRAEAFHEALRQLALAVGDTPWDENEGWQVELNTAIVLIFLSQLNRNGLHHLFPRYWQMLFDSEAAWPWSKRFEHFQRLADRLFEFRQDHWNDSVAGLVEKIHALVVANLHGDVSLTRLAQELHFNPAYLSRLYKQSTGRNLREYIAEVRIDKSKELLEQSEFKIYEIVGKVGFESVTSFTRFFKRMTGMTPQEYRDLIPSER